MDLHCMQSPTVSSIPRSVLLEKPFFFGQSIVKLPGNKSTCPDARRLKYLDFRARSSGTTKIKSQAQDVITPSGGGQKDGNLVFVAGATGRVGSRTVRELLKLGFSVQAGVRSIQRAISLVQSVKNLKLDDAAGGIQPIDKFELVECDLEKPDQIRPALGNSSTVICCIGASEKEVLDITGPYRIDYQATKNLIDAATSAKVKHFILVTSLGTNKFGFPAALLNLFWGVLCWKRKAEEALLAGDLPYTIVRPGGMERPTDSFKETHNLTLYEEDTLFGGLVSNLQVAELLAFMAKKPRLSCCKVVEVIAETTAPLTPMGELLKKIPSQREDICGFKESDDADESKPAVADKTYTEKEPEQVKATKAMPQSPYVAYEDLKPPTSPTPTPSSGSGAVKASKLATAPSTTSTTSETSSISVDNVIPWTAPKKSSPLSPYTSYEDLKPPTSPTPTPSTGFGAIKASKTEITPTAESSTTLSTEVEPQLTDGNDVATSEGTEDGKDPTKSLPTNHSPFLAYDDFKPPSSPSPSVPTFSGNDKPENPIDDKSKSRPLSPYTMYDDLKPPSSPSPSPKNI